MASAELTIHVTDLDAGGRHYAFPLRAAWIRGLLEGHEATATDADGVLDVRASRSGNDVVVHGTLQARLQVPCARCLDPVVFEIREQLSLLFVPGKVPPVEDAEQGGATAKPEAREKAKKVRRREPDEYEMTTADADTLPFDGETVVLDDLVRDELILETPIFPLCSDDCPGMSRASAQRGESGVSASNSRHSKAKGDEPEAADREVDPRLLPLLRLKNQRD